MNDPVAVPGWQLLNDLFAKAKHADNRVYDAVDFGVIDDTATVLRLLKHELEEAHRIIALYWDGFDLLNDGPDQEDVAHANALINEAHTAASAIAEAYRRRQASDR
jgi:hypothetical protein